MKREITCIVCPRGCRMTADIQGETITVTGHTCPRGEKHAMDEILHPVRSLTSIVRVSNRPDTMVSVKSEAPIPKGEIDVAFLGDSLTDGYDLEKYYPEFKTANRGIAGETTGGLESRLQVSVYDLKPKVCVMLIGANNMDTMFKLYIGLVLIKTVFIYRYNFSCNSSACKLHTL